LAETIKRISIGSDVIKNNTNLGVGASIVVGYKKAIEKKADVIAVMAGDGQMNPDDLPAVLDPIVYDKADYVKGNRLITKDVRTVMPGVRYFGNSLLTVLTKIVSGYWHVMDPQCGYTTISRSTLEKMDLDTLYPRYGFPNDMLVRLNVLNARVKDVPVKAVYGAEKSGIKLRSYIPMVSMLLLRGFLWRLKEKYLIRDFHPLVLFYLMGFLLLPLGTILGLFLIYVKYLGGQILTTPSVVLCALLIITGLQSILFAMMFDMEYNKPK
jgi:glycosyltransferase involved in cell wall biosynthesis